MRKPGKAPERGRLRGRDPPLGRLLRWKSSGWPLEVGDPPYSGRWGNPMLLGMELPIGAVKSPPGTPGMLSGKVGPPECDTCKSDSCRNIPSPGLSMSVAMALASWECAFVSLDLLIFGTHQAPLPHRSCL